MKAKEYYFASIFLPHNNDVLSPHAYRFLDRVSFSFPGILPPFWRNRNGLAA